MPDLLTPDDPPEFAQHFVGTVTRSYWSNPATESNGKANFDRAFDAKLYWDVRIDELLQDNAILTEDTVQVQLSIPRGFETTDNPDVVRHEDDNSDINPSARPVLPKSSTKSPGSELGQLMGVISGKLAHYGSNGGKPAWAGDGLEELTYDMTGAAEHLRDNTCADPRDCTIWNGTQWLFRGVVKDWGMKDPTTGEKITPKAKTLPVIFRGVEEAVGASGSGGSGGGSGGGGGSVSATKTLEEIATAVGATLPTPNDDLVADVAKLVHTSSTYSQFARQALSLVGDDEELKGAVMDQVNGPWGAK